VNVDLPVRTIRTCIAIAVAVSCVLAVSVFAVAAVYLIRWAAGLR
jgi:hypothetical protein